jgi:hypothetical protein
VVDASRKANGECASATSRSNGTRTAKMILFNRMHSEGNADTGEEGGGEIFFAGDGEVRFKPRRFNAF